MNPASAQYRDGAGIDALSLPVTAGDGRTLGVLTLLSMAGELEHADLRKLLPEMRDTANFCAEVIA